MTISEFTKAQMYIDAIFVLHIDYGPNSCSSSIDWSRSLSVFSEAVLFPSLLHSFSLSLWQSHSAASPTLAAIRSLITCLLCVCVCLYTSFAVESVYLWSLHSFFCPLCVYKQSVSCSCRPGSPLHVNLLHARCWLAARPPNLFPVSSSHFFSLPPYWERERSLMSGWRSEGLFYCSPACSLSSWLPLLQPI